MGTEDINVNETETATENVTENVTDTVSEIENVTELSEASNNYKVRNLKAAVEACLFSCGTAVEGSRLAKALEISESLLDSIIEGMQNEYNESGRGVRIIKLEDKYQMCTKNEYYDVLARLVNMPKKQVLTDVLLETLSIIAYKQPVTRQEIEAIRGVSCSHAVNKLIEYNLVMEVGRLDAVGRPILFGTTDDFLRSFGVSNMDELPIVTQDKIEDFKRQAMEEVKVEVDT